MGNPRKILVVDDEPVVRQLIAHSLTDQGFEVLLAENGKEGFEVATKAKPDLVLTDVNMPGTGGIELMEMLKRSDLKGTPVVLMTGDLDTYEKSKTAGARILSKPFRRQELVEFINQVLDPTMKPA